MRIRPCIAALAFLLLAAGAVRAERPRLVVAVSVDQLAYELLERFRDDFSDDGIFRKIEKEGAWYTNCMFGHAVTFTAPGHAVMLTGVYADKHGIIANDWYDRASGKPMYCVDCSDSPLVGGSGRGASPKTLLAPTVGDMLKEATAGKAKVFGIGLKDRSGMLMAGRRANAAFWLDGNGHWITSSYYAAELPEYLTRLNRAESARRYGGKTWELLHDLSKYRLHRPDDYPHEGDGFGLGRAFPHKLAEATDRAYLKQLGLTPYGNDLTLETALELLVREELGKDETPDILCVSLSTNDYIGHNYGPFSLEVHDATLRTDLQLARFAEAIDKQLEGAPWIMVITADHGVGPIPEYAKTLGLPAARSPLGSLSKLSAALERELVKQFGPPPGKSYVEELEGHQVYLRMELREDKQRFLEILTATRDWLRANPAVALAFHREELLAGEGDPLFRRAFHAERSGEVQFCMKPYMIHGSTPATHGSPWEYDRHVPLLWWGSGIAPGRFEDPVSPAAIAPTLVKILGLETEAEFAVPAVKTKVE